MEGQEKERIFWNVWHVLKRLFVLFDFGDADTGDGTKLDSCARVKFWYICTSNFGYEQ